MKRVWPLLLVGILFLTGIAGSFLLMKQPDGSVVEIVQDNQVLYRFNLDQTENQTIEVEYESRSNTIEIIKFVWQKQNARIIPVSRWDGWILRFPSSACQIIW